MSKQEGLCNIPVLSETSLRKLSEGEGAPSCFTLKVMSATFFSVCFLSLKEANCETKKNVFTPKSPFVLEKIKIWKFRYSNFMCLQMPKHKKETHFTE